MHMYVCMSTSLIILCGKYNLSPPTPTCICWPFSPVQRSLMLQEMKGWHRPRMECLVEEGVDFICIETIAARVCTSNGTLSCHQAVSEQSLFCHRAVTYSRELCNRGVRLVTSLSLLLEILVTVYSEHISTGLVVTAPLCMLYICAFVGA